ARVLEKLGKRGFAGLTRALKLAAKHPHRSDVPKGLVTNRSAAGRLPKLSPQGRGESEARACLLLGLCSCPHPREARRLLGCDLLGLQELLVTRDVEVLLADQHPQHRCDRQSVVRGHPLKLPRLVLGKPHVERLRSLRHLCQPHTRNLRSCKAY